MSTTFDPAKDLGIFDDFFKKRPEVTKESLIDNLNHYYLPYIYRLLELKKKKNNDNGIIIGVSAIQGAGKTTQGEIMEILLKHFGYSSVSRSIDDHYVTHKQLCEIRQKDPRFIRRGVTHDIPLAILNLRDLQQMGDQPIIVSGYDKGAHHGDGDRFRWVNIETGVVIKCEVSSEQLTVNKEMKTVPALRLISMQYNGTEIAIPERMGSDVPLVSPMISQEVLDWLIREKGEFTIEEKEHDTVIFKNHQELEVPKKELPNGWRLIAKKPDFIFYDGWMLGARTITDESVFDTRLPALETEEAKQFAKDVNKKLFDYEMLWEMIEFMNVLYVPNYQDSLKWRDQAEEALRQKGEGMTHDEIVEFVHYFWRSVHPGIHIKNVAHSVDHTNQVVIINDDHSIKEVLSPHEARQKYP